MALNRNTLASPSSHHHSNWFYVKPCVTHGSYFLKGKRTFIHSTCFV